MKKRSSLPPVKVYLTKEEHMRLSHLSRASSYSKSAYMRSLLNLVIPRAMPPVAYHSFIRQLSAIGNNFNQIARIANTNGYVDQEAYKDAYERLAILILEIRRALQLPEELPYGNHKD